MLFFLCTIDVLEAFCHPLHPPRTDWCMQGCLWPWFHYVVTVRCIFAMFENVMTKQPQCVQTEYDTQFAKKIEFIANILLQRINPALPLWFKTISCFQTYILFPSVVTRQTTVIISLVVPPSPSPAYSSRSFHGRIDSTMLGILLELNRAENCRTALAAMFFALFFVALPIIQWTIRARWEMVNPF